MMSHDVAFRVRALEPDEAELLEQFAPLALPVPPVATAPAPPLEARYYRDWGRAGDEAVVALHQEDDAVAVGCAWARLQRPGDAGLAFQDELTPEIVVAVEENWFWRGVPQALVEALFCRLRAVALDVRWDARHQKFVTLEAPVEVEQPEMKMPPRRVSVAAPAVSLGTVQMFERLGFQKVPHQTDAAWSVLVGSLWPSGDWRRGELDRAVRVNWAGAPDDYVSVDYRFDLRFALFTREERRRFRALMNGLPGREAATGLGMDMGEGKTMFSYFGPSPVKAAIHWPHLWAQVESEGLRVRGDVEWKQWCDWDDAFFDAARQFPHGLRFGPGPNA